MSFSLIQPLREIPLAFVDVETTGASADFGHRVIEIGISQAMVEGKPTFQDEFPRMKELMQGAVVVGHNVRFDLGFLYREFRRSGSHRPLRPAAFVAPT